MDYIRAGADEFKRFKREINLGEYLINDGFSVDKNKSSKNCLVLKNDATKFLVGIDKDTSHYFYSNVNNPQDKGSIIDYLQNHKNLSFPEIRQELRGYVSDSFYSITTNTPAVIQPSTHDTQKISSKIASFDTVNESEYLAERGISKETLNSHRFSGTILADEKSNLIFPHRDKDGYSGYEIRTENGKFFSSGGSKGLWFSKFYQEDKTLVICESQIDALSHYQLFQDSHTRYITTGGSLSNKQKELLEIACEKSSQRVNQIVLANDNDSGGRKIDQQIKESMPNIEFQIQKPTQHKDWNKMLMSQQKKKEKEKYHSLEM